MEKMRTTKEEIFGPFELYILFHTFKPKPKQYPSLDVDVLRILV